MPGKRRPGGCACCAAPTDLDDVIAEVPPDEGTLLIFRNDPNAWHGFHAFEGPRRVIQLNWVTDMGVVRREQTRHRISAFFKACVGKAPPKANAQDAKATSAASLSERRVVQPDR